MNLFDKFGNTINEAVYGVGYSDPIYKNLKGFYATDKELEGYSYTGNENKDQVLIQVSENKRDRDFLFSQIDIIKNHHLANTIKKIIIDDCFNGLTDKNLVTIQYRDPDDPKKCDMFNEAIKELLRDTAFFDVFWDCLQNEGIDYGEMFLSTDCRIGEGIVEIVDDIDIKKHIAIYKKLSPVGYIRFNNSNGKINPDDFIAADVLSHFMINPKKIPLKINYDYGKDYDLPEKIRCSEPLLTPVIDLITEYNCLEKVRPAIELNKALAPILLGIGINSNSTIEEHRKQLQQYSIAINKTRNAVLNNLNNLNVGNLLANMNPIQLIPYDTNAGTNKIEQINVAQIESDLTGILNDMKITIARTVGIPDNCLASTNLISDKGDNIITNPRYSMMLSGIQQSLAKGIVEYVYKHLRYKFSDKDSSGKAYLRYKINKNLLEVKFKSVTNVDNRLDMEQMLLTANTMSEIAGVIDVVSGSPNLPVRTNFEKYIKLWQNTTEPYPYLRDIFEEDPNYGQEFPGEFDDSVDGAEVINSADEVRPLPTQKQVTDNSSQPPEKTKVDNKDPNYIKDIFK